MTWQLEILRKWLDWKLHTADNLKTNNYYLETFSKSWSYSLLPFLPNRCNHWCSISTLLKQPQLISYSPNTTFPMQPVWSALFSLVWYPFQVGRKPRLCDWSFDLFKNMLNIENMDSYSLNFENIKKHGHVFENMTLTALRLSKTLNQLSKRCQIKKNIQLVAWGCQMEDDPCWDSTQSTWSCLSCPSVRCNYRTASQVTHRHSTSLLLTHLLIGDKKIIKRKAPKSDRRDMRLLRHWLHFWYSRRTTFIVNLQ